MFFFRSSSAAAAASFANLGVVQRRQTATRRRCHFEALETFERSECKTSARKSLADQHAIRVVHTRVALADFRPLDKPKNQSAKILHIVENAPLFHERHQQTNHRGAVAHDEARQHRDEAATAGGERRARARARLLKASSPRIAGSKLISSRARACVHLVRRRSVKRARTPRAKLITVATATAAAALTSHERRFRGA